MWQGKGDDVLAEDQPVFDQLVGDLGTIASSLVAPSNLVATAVSSSQVNLSWTDGSPSETGFYLERRQGASGSWQQIASLPATTTTYSDTGLSPSTSYSYQVQDYVAASSSDFSNTATATTLATPTAPCTLTIQSSNPGSGATIYYSTSSTWGMGVTPLAPQSYSANTVVSLTAADPAGSNHFVKWQLDGMDYSLTTSAFITMDTNHTMTAVYGSTSAPLTLTSVAINGPGAINEGTSQTYTATATFSDGSTLTVTPQWSLGQTGAPASINASSGVLTAGAVSADTVVSLKASYTYSGITQTAATNVTIVNTGTTQLSTLSISTSGQGDVTRAPNQNQFQTGAQVVLTANPATNYQFTGWGGDAASYGTTNPITVTMNGNKNVSATFTYDAAYYGSVQVVIQPQGAAEAGGQWRLDNGPWQNSGATVTPSANGSHNIFFSNVPGYTTPAMQMITVVSNQTNEITGTYVSQLPPGGIQVTLLPPAAVSAGAQWRTVGGSGVWQNSGAVLSGLSSGNYTIEFNAAPGWSLPPTQTVAVNDGTTTTASATYGPPAVMPVIYSIGPQTGPIAGGTQVTINGANFLPPVSVTFGGISATNVTVVSSSQVIAQTPLSAAYHTVSVSVAAAGGTATQSNGFTYIVPRGNHMDLVSQIGGSVQALATQGNYLYSGEGTGVVVYDISNPTSPSPVGRLALPDMVYDISVSGNYAYVADGAGGVFVVNISTPTAPAVTGFYETPGQANGIAVQNNLAYVADGSADFEILDCSNPSAPVLLGSAAAVDFYERVVLMPQGSKLYACVAASGHGLQIFDVTNPANPVVQGSFQADGPTNDITVSGNTAYLANYLGQIQTLSILDLTNPQTPVLKGYDTIGLAYSIAVNGNTAYLGEQGSFRSVNVANPAAPQNIGYNTTISGVIRRILLNGNYAYLATAGSGLQVVSIASPTNMPEVAHTVGAFEVDDIALNGYTVYAACGYSGFNAINSSNPDSLQYNGHLDFASNGCTSVANAGTNVFLGLAAGGGIAVVQANQSTPQLVSTYSQSFNHKLFCDGGLIYSAASNTTVAPNESQFLVLNFSNLSDLTVQSQITDTASQGYTLCAISYGDRAYFSDTAGVHVVNFTSTVNPTRMGDLATTGYPVGVGLAVANNGNTLLVSGGPADAPSGWTGGLLIVDVTDGNHPMLLNTALPGISVLDVTVVGSLAYVASGYQGVYVLDISNINNPVIRANYLTGGYAETVQVLNNSVYVAAQDGGLVVLSLLDFTPPTVTITSSGSTVTTSNPTFNVSGQASDNTGVSQVVWSDSLGGGGTATGTTNWQSGNITLLPGANVLTFTANDAAGNTGSASMTVIYTPTDTTPPTINIISPTTSDHFTTENPSVDLQGVANDNVGVTAVTWSNDRGGSGTATGTTNWTVSGIPLLEGPNTITLTASDAAGNTSTAVITAIYSPPDETPPSIAILFPTANTSYSTQDAQLNLSGTASDDQGVVSVQWSNSSGGSGNAQGTTIWNANGIALQPGMNVITVTAVNEAGNATAATLAVTFIPPVTPTFSLPTGTYIGVQSVTISSTTSGALIAYTTDGSTPTESGGLLTNGTSLSNGGPVSISANTTLNAIAFTDGYTYSAVATAAYIINIPQAATPTFSPAADIYTSAQSVTISSTTGSASIRYTTDGSTPSETHGMSLPNGGSVSISNTTPLKAIAYEGGFNDSAVATATYVINIPGMPVTLLSDSFTSAATAQFKTTGNPGIGVQNLPLSADWFSNGSSTNFPITYIQGGGISLTPLTTQSVTTFFDSPGSYFSIGVGATLTLSFDFTIGSTPANSPTGIRFGLINSGGNQLTLTTGNTNTKARTYSGYYGLFDPAQSSGSASVMLESRAASTLNSSFISSLTFNTVLGSTNGPAVLPNPGTDTYQATLTINNTGSGMFLIFGITDGGTPVPGYTATTFDANSSVTSFDGLTIGAITGATTPLTISNITISYFTDTPATAPTFSLPADTYSGPQTVTISSLPGGPSIRYTTDGSTPSETNGILVPSGQSVSITITTTTTINAIAFAPGMPDSAVTTAVYTINVPVPTVTRIQGSNGYQQPAHRH